MKKLIALCAAFLTFFTLISVLPSSEESGIYDSTLRLRVIANSDGEEDQRVKLLVRDAILAYAETNYAHLTTREEALAAVFRDQATLTALAETVLRAEGHSYGATVWVGEETYGTRAYDSFAMPAGDYLSLQIRLGEANGANWWCVLFPPMCLGGALRSEPEDSVPVGLSTDQYELITSGQKEDGRYHVKFRLLELLTELFQISGY
ncbi:MAG: stage II sporulation protein R [Clostridia bacterium]|nr:stage II sporulation protein R [Clostridia bacterium]